LKLDQVKPHDRTATRPGTSIRHFDRGVCHARFWHSNGNGLSVSTGIKRGMMARQSAASQHAGRSAVLVSISKSNVRVSGGKTWKS
jgi:hypothetical protein